MGHAVTPAINLTNSRRVMSGPTKSNTEYRTALGQKATLQGDQHMSALPAEADIAEPREHVR
jgi:hypothetical protein